MHRNLAGWIEKLRKEDRVVDVRVPVDPHLELAEIHRRVIQEGGPVLFFHNVRGSAFPVVTNLFGTSKRVEHAFGKEPERFVKEIVELATQEFPPTFSTLFKKRNTLKRLIKLGCKERGKAPVIEVDATRGGLSKLPFITSWPEDGGPFITLPLVYTEPVGKGSPNLGMYRIQRHGEDRLGLHFQIGKGGGYHLHEAEALNTPLPVSIFVGGPPATLLSAIAPLPENVPELIFASMVLGNKLERCSIKGHPHKLLAEADFAILGDAHPHERMDEGPFGDHYGYYSLKHPFPVFRLKKLYHRKNAIWPATVVGKPRQEDFYIGEYLQKLLSPLFPIVMPGVQEIWSYGETGFHSLAAARVKERYAKEAMQSAFRILGEGQLSLTKFLLLTDQPVQVSTIKAVLPAILARFNPASDLYIFSHLSMDTLDYTGPKLNHGSRGVLLGLGEERRRLSRETPEGLPFKAAVFCPGCLTIESTLSIETILYQFKEIEGFPLVILVDSVDETLSSDQHFLWTVFTRFEPAADIHFAQPKIVQNHICATLPILIDARMKPSYPKEVEVDKATKALVDNRWTEYGLS